MIPIAQIPTEEIRFIHLSDCQWRKLSILIDPSGGVIPDSTKESLGQVLKTYFWSTFISRQSMKPSDFSKPFKKLVAILDELLPILENHFFPRFHKWPDKLCSELVRDRLSGSSSTPEKALIKEAAKERIKNDYSVNDRNEYIRYMMTLYVNGSSNQLKLPHVQMEALLANVYGLRLASKQVLKTLPSARGKHGDPNLLRLIVDVQNIYRDAGGIGLYTLKAEGFLRLLMEYVVDFSCGLIGEDHSGSLKTSIRGSNLREIIKKARAVSLQMESDEGFSDTSVV